MAGKPGAKSPHEAYYFYWGRELQAVRSCNWKLHLPHSYSTLAGKPGGTGGKPAAYSPAKTELALYDLEADPAEKDDVAAKHPEVVARLTKMAEKARDDLGDTATKKEGKGVRPPGSVNP
jgi:arylsulfatase A